MRVTLAVTAVSISARQQQRLELLLEQLGRGRGSLTACEWGAEGREVALGGFL
jgi:hypothetical protein